MYYDIIILKVVDCMAIFLKQSKYKNGKIFLSIVNGYYDNITKNSKQSTIEKIGFVDDLKNTIDDPISYYKQKAYDLNNEKKKSKTYTKTYNLDEELSDNDYRYNIGFIDKF